jgi:hypothetical protein
MAGADFSNWIDDGDKYAIVALSVKTEGTIPSGPISPNLRILADTKFSIPQHWQEWLGSIRAKEVEDCNLFLFSKARSSTPAILDEENKRLSQLVGNFYLGLLLACTFAPAHRPVLLTGAHRDREIDIRQQQDFDSPIPCVWRPYPPVLHKDIELAARLAENLDALVKTPLRGGHWRLFRTVHIYAEARPVADILDRLHQYCRCIDGLILPDAGKTKQQFKSKTELLIGPKHHDLIGEIYDVRSAVEHLHENRYLEGFDREIRLDLLRKLSIVEHVARTAIARVIGDSALWPHFANTTALAAFWGLPADERQRIWGAPINPMDAVSGFDPKYIHDGLLGGP